MAVRKNTTPTAAKSTTKPKATTKTKATTKIKVLNTASTTVDTPETQVIENMQDLEPTPATSPIPTELGKRHGFRIVEFKNVLITDIERGFNIRTQKNVESVDDIIDSIRENGILEAIHITPDNIALDGYRRLYCAGLLGIKDVPVVVVDVPSKEIPFYQKQCGNQKPYSKNELTEAILEYVHRNPVLTDTQVAQKFGVTHTTVGTITRLLREAPELSKEVNDGKLSRRSALKILATAKQSNIKPDDLTSQVLSELPPSVDSTYNGRDVNRVLSKICPDVKVKDFLETPDKEITTDETKEKRIGVLSLVSRVFSLLSATTIDDNVVLGGTINQKDYELICKLLQRSNVNKSVKRGVIEKIYLAPYKDIDVYEKWFNASEKRDHIVLVATSDNQLATYEGQAQHLAELLNSRIIVEAGLDVFRVPQQISLIERLVEKHHINIVLVMPDPDYLDTKEGIENIESEYLEEIAENDNTDSETVTDSSELTNEATVETSTVVDYEANFASLIANNQQIVEIDDDLFESVVSGDDDDYLATFG